MTNRPATAAALARAAGLALLCVPSAFAASAAEVELSPLFSDGAVLQRGAPIRIFGRAEPGERVVVRLGPNGEALRAGEGVADRAGRFEVELEACEQAGPLELRVGDQVREVRLGEVWICSGQSNMEWPLAWAGEPEREIAAAELPGLWLFKVPRNVADEPWDELADGTDIEGRELPLAGWRACSPETARMFSAVGYHFGRELRAALGEGVPVGLIHCAFGGTAAEAWTTPERLAGDPALADSRARELEGPNAHSVLWNAMVAPLARLSIAGVIWYQGEANVGVAEQYRELFPAMIESWREGFGLPELPFLFVQLAAFLERRVEPTESAWAELREAQAMALALPHTGLACAIDIGDAVDIHPKNKREVGRRLALVALRELYGGEREAEGPRFAGLERERGHAGEGWAVRVRFDHAQGLRTTEGADGVVRGFALAGEDGRYFWAEARIDRESVVLSSPRVPRPLHVRYAWADNPAATLQNSVGLPAVPFRTDGPRGGGLEAAREAPAGVGAGQGGR